MVHHMPFLKKERRKIEKETEGEGDSWVLLSINQKSQEERKGLVGSGIAIKNPRARNIKGFLYCISVKLKYTYFQFSAECKYFLPHYKQKYAPFIVFTTYILAINAHSYTWINIL